MSYERAQAERLPPGESAAWARPGDFILVRGASWRSRIITLYERLCFRRPEERYCAYWSHAALVVGANGAIVEAGTAGVVLQHIEKYRDVEYHYVAVQAAPSDRWRAVRFAASRVGSSYSRLAIAVLAASALTGGRIVPRNPNCDICAGLVAGALSRAGAIFDKSPALMLPGDLAKHYEVTLSKEGR
jgi:hypothetical protein